MKSQSQATHNPGLHHGLEPVLIVEDLVENQKILERLCQRMGLESDVAENGLAALQLIESGRRYSVYLVDLMMPVMGGEEFISRMLPHHPEAVILVQTSVDSPDTIINIMKIDGVFDYLLKPIDFEIFPRSINKALTYRRLKAQEDAQKEQVSLKLRTQLEWLNYKQSKRESADTSTEKNLIYNLKTSMSQGAGFGSMVTLLDLLQSVAKKGEDGNYIVPGSLLETLFENNLICQNTIDGLNSISQVLDQEVPLVACDSLQLNEALPRFLLRIEPYLGKKRMKIVTALSQKKVPLQLNLEKLGEAIEELVINAYKYSREGGEIQLFSHLAEGFYCIAVKSDLAEGAKGIPEEYEKLVLEPFIRLEPPEESVALIERFSMGLGLTVVDHVARKHSGHFFIHNIRDHTREKVQPAVLAELFIPVDTTP